MRTRERRATALKRDSLITSRPWSAPRRARRRDPQYSTFTPTVRQAAWRRWTLLAMLAHALLAVIAATERAEHPPPPGELISLTYNEIPPLHQEDHRPRPPTHRSAGLITLATTPSTPGPRQPLLPPTNAAHMITIYGWSTRRSSLTSPYLAVRRSGA